MPRPARNSVLTFAVSALVLLAVWTYKVVVVPRPFWAFAAGDGEVVTFFNSLALLARHRPPSVFHPGTPVQILGAGIAAAIGGISAIDRVLLASYVAGLAATLTAVGGLAFGPLRGVRPWLGVAVVLSFFAHPAALLNMTVFAAYMFHFAVAWLALAALARAVEGPARLAPRPVLLAGLAIGFACSVHLMFLPLLPAAVIGVALAGTAEPVKPHVPKPPPLAVGIVGVALAVLTVAAMALYARLHVGVASLWLFLAITLAVAVAAIAGAPRLGLAGSPPREIGAHLLTLAAGTLAGWMATTFFVLDRLWARIGQVGEGYGQGVAAVHERLIVENLRALLRIAPAWSALVALGIAALATETVRTLGGSAARARRARAPMAAALLVALVLGVLLGLKQSNLAVSSYPGITLRYLLPAAAILTFGFAWLAAAAPAAPSSERWRVIVGVAFALLATAGFVRQAVTDFAYQRRVTTAARVERAAVDARIGEIARALGRRPTVLFWDVQRPSWALRSGDFNADSLFSAQIDRLYPREGLFDFRYRRPYLPAGAAGFDALVGYEREINPTNVGDVDSFRRFLAGLGPVERLTTGLVEPVVVVWCPGPPPGCRPR